MRLFRVRPLISAYRTTKHDQYAQGIVAILRSFLTDARPPAQRPVTWYGYNGP